MVSPYYVNEHSNFQKLITLVTTQKGLVLACKLGILFKCASWSLNLNLIGLPIRLAGIQGKLQLNLSLPTVYT